MTCLCSPLSSSPNLPPSCPCRPPAPLLFAQGYKGLRGCCGPTEVLSGHSSVPGHGPERRQRSKGG